MKKEKTKSIVCCSQCIFRNRCERDISFVNAEGKAKVRIPITGCAGGIHIDEAAAYFQELKTE